MACTMALCRCAVGNVGLKVGIKNVESATHWVFFLKFFRIIRRKVPER